MIERVKREWSICRDREWAVGGDGEGKDENKKKIRELILLIKPKQILCTRECKMELSSRRFFQC